MENQTNLINYIDSVITQLNEIKTNPDKEIEKEYFSLACIAWRMEMYSVRGIRRRRGKDSEDE